MNGFACSLAPHIQSLLALKHAMGPPYEESERHLRNFDAMCAQDCPGQAMLTRDMAMARAVGRPSEHVNGQMPRITPVRQLAKHMSGLGVTAYVNPSGIPGRQVRYRPHIFSHEHLRAIFDAADSIRASGYGGQRHLIISVIFRMIYCLGLRPGEARLRALDHRRPGSRGQPRLTAAPLRPSPRPRDREHQQVGARRP